MRRRQRFELGNERLMVSERELRVDQFLARRYAELFEALDLVPCEGLVREIGQRRSPPEPERGAEGLSPSRGIARGIRAPAFREQAFEPTRIDLLRLDAQDIAARLRDQHVGRPEQLAQPRHLMVEAVLRGTRRPLDPRAHRSSGRARPPHSR